MDKRMLNLIDNRACVALIPARGGSKSVPKKNIRIFQGHPLIAYSIAAARLARNIDRVIVSTDSEEIAEIARHYGAEVPFLRPAEYAQDNSPDIDFVKHAIQWMADYEGTVPRYLAHIRVTSPIRDYRVVEQGIQQLQRDKEASSLRSGYICIHPPYKWFQFDSSPYLKPLMEGMSCDEANMARQNFPTVLVPNGYVDVLKSDYIIKTDLMHGDHMIGFITEKVPDIDTEEDIKNMEIYEKLTNALYPLKKYLKEL